MTEDYKSYSLEYAAIVLVAPDEYLGNGSKGLHQEAVNEGESIV
jgi:hypothetical protein